jgi:hypothetical protein
MEQAPWGLIALVEGQCRLTVQHGRITSRQRPAVHVHAAACHLHIGQPRRIERDLGLLRAIEQAAADGGVGVDRDRAVAPIGRRHQAQPAALVGRAEVLLFVARCDATLAGQDPDLQEMRRVLRCMVVFAVLHAGAGAHALHVAGADHAAVGSTGRSVAHAVLVRQLAAEHVADDFHVAVAVRSEAGAGGDAVFVDDAQVSHPHVLRVVVVGE